MTDATTQRRAAGRPDRGQNYERLRFEVSGRMRRLDRWERRLAEHVMSLVGSGGTVLDAPCGSGRFIEIFGHAKQLTLLDRNASMLTTCRQKAAAFPSARCMEGDIMSLPLPDNSVDAVWCMRLFHHFSDDAMRIAALRELARVSRRYVAMTFYNSKSFRALRRRVLGKKPTGKPIPYEHMVELARGVGLRVVERRPKINLIEQQCFVLFEKA